MNKESSPGEKMKDKNNISKNKDNVKDGNVSIKEILTEWIYKDKDGNIRSKYYSNK